MNKSTDHLMELIHALSPSEKRYFKLYAERHKSKESSNYIRLFNFLEAQDDFEEEKIQKQFKNERFLNQLPVAKNYLYNMILKSLSSYHQEQTRFEELHLVIHYIKILHGKNLLTQARKWCTKAEEMATKYQYYPILLELLQLRSRLIHDTSFEDVDEQELLRFSKKEEEALHHINLLSMFDWLGLQIYRRHWQKRFIRSKEEYLNEFKKLFATPELKNDPGPDNLIARYYYFSYNSTYHLLTGDLKKSIDLCFKGYKVFDDNPFLIEEHPQVFFTAVNNYAVILLQTGQMIENIKVLKALDRIQRPTEFLRGKILYCQNAFAFYAHFMRSDLQNALSYAEKIKQLLPLFEDFILLRDLLTLYYNLALYYFDAGKWDVSLDFVNLLLQRKDLNQVPDIASFTRILQLINLMELKSYEVLPHFIRSAFRYITTRKQLFQVEKIFLKYLKGMAIAHTEEKFHIILKKCKEELEAFIDVPYEQNAFQYFDFITWIESKLNKEPFAKTLNEKYSNTVTVTVSGSSKKVKAKTQTKK